MRKLKKKQIGGAVSDNTRTVTPAGVPLNIENLARAKGEYALPVTNGLPTIDLPLVEVTAPINMTRYGMHRENPKYAKVKEIEAKYGVDAARDYLYSTQLGELSDKMGEVFSDALITAGTADLPLGRLFKGSKAATSETISGLENMAAPLRFTSEHPTLVQQQRLLHPEIEKKFLNQYEKITGTNPERTAGINNFLAEHPRFDYKEIHTTPENYRQLINETHGKTRTGFSESYGMDAHDDPAFSFGPGDEGTLFSDAKIYAKGKPEDMYRDWRPFTNKEKEITEAHEKLHGVINNFSDAGMKDFEAATTSKNIGGYGPDQFYDESVARMAQFKNAFGFKGNESFTKPHMDYIRDNYAKDMIDNNITDFLDIIPKNSPHENQFIKNMNKYAFGATGAIGTDALLKKKMGGSIQSKNMKTSLVYRQMGGPAKPNFLQQLQTAGNTFGQEPIDQLLTGANLWANIISTGKENRSNKAYQDFYQHQMMQPSQLVNPSAFGNPYEMQMGGILQPDQRVKFKGPGFKFKGTYGNFMNAFGNQQDNSQSAGNLNSFQSLGDNMINVDIATGRPVNIGNMNPAQFSLYDQMWQDKQMKKGGKVSAGGMIKKQKGGVIAKSKADQAGGYFKFPNASNIQFPGSGQRQFVPGPFPLMVKDDNGIQMLNNYPIQTQGHVTEYPIYQYGGQVNFTAKPVDEDNATIEAEKGEYILGGGAARNPFDDEDSDIGVGLYKIGGNKHYNGGTKLAANPGDFIFSDDKDLAFDQDVAKELVGRDITKTRLRTPAKLVDNYNKLNQFIDMSQNSKATSIDRKTAILNTENILDKLADIAIGQEAKKGFPNGIPAFAQASIDKRTAGAENSPTEMQPNFGESEQESFQTGGVYSGGWGNTRGDQRSDLYMVQPGATNNNYYEIPWPDRQGSSRSSNINVGAPVDLGPAPLPEPKSFSATDFLKNTFGNLGNLFGTPAQAAPTNTQAYSGFSSAMLGANSGIPTSDIGNYWDRYGLGKARTYPAHQYGTPLSKSTSTAPAVVDNPAIPYMPKSINMNALGSPEDIPNYGYGQTTPLILPNGSDARTLGGGKPTLKAPATRDYNSTVNPNAAELYGLYAANKRYANRYPTAQRNFELDNVDALITSNYKPLSAQPYLNNIQRQLATFNSNNSGFGPVSYARNSYAFTQALNAQQQAIGQVEQQNIQRQDQMNQLLAQNQGAKAQSRLQFQDKYLNQLEAVNNNAEMAAKYRMANTSQLLNAYTKRKQEQQATNAMLDNFQYDANGNLTPIPGRSLKDAVMNANTSTQMSTQLGYVERMMQMMQRYGIKNSSFIDDIIKNATGTGH